MDSYGNGYSSVGGKRSADDGGAETESDSKKQRCEPSRVVHLRNLHQYVTEQEVISTGFFKKPNDYNRSKSKRLFKTSRE